MREKNRIVVAVSVWGCLFFAIPGVQAQSDNPKVEVGAHFSTLWISDLDETDAGFGGWAAYRASDKMALEGEFSFFSEARPVTGRKTQGLFGIRLGGRLKRVDLFGKIRPGFIHFGQPFIRPGTVCIAIFPVPIECLVRKTNLALDVGGVLEFYPSRRSLVRFDLGDTIIRLANQGKSDQNRPIHAFQFSAGIGFRF